MPLRRPGSRRPPSIPSRSSGPSSQLEDTCLGQVEQDDDEHERRSSDDQDDVDELASNSRAAALDAHRHFEPGAQRGHHSGRGPAEDEEADEAECRCRRRQVLDLTGHVRAARSPRAAAHR